MNFTIGFDKRDTEKLHAAWNQIIEKQRWSEGPFTEEFEKKWWEWNGLQAVAFGSWSGAALAALEFFNLKGRTVLCQANTFIATPMAIIKAGANVEFVDCNREDLCMSYEDLKVKIDKFNPAAVFVVHIGGHLAFQINEISRLCKERGIVLLEDCAHAHGASWNGKKPGSWGDAGIYSFYATKTITTGEGGMLVTNNSALVEFAKKFRNYGKMDYKVQGLNFRMSEFTAAIGCVQADRMEEIVRWKNEYAKQYLDPVYPRRVKFPEGMVSGYYKYIVFDPIEKSTGKVYDDAAFKFIPRPYSLPNAEWITQNHWCAPLYYKGDEIQHVVDGAPDVNAKASPPYPKFKKVMVTGGSGFIGSHVVDKLIGSGINVRIYDLVYPEFTNDYSDEKKKMIEYYQGSLVELDRLRMACTGIDAIYHLAAVADVNDVAADPAYAQRINDDGTFNVLESARLNKQIKRVIFASTVWVYQNTPEVNGELTEDASISHPDHFYTATKISSEAKCIAYNKLYHVPFTILRFGIPYGTRARGAIVSAIFTRKALNKEPISIEGDGSQYRKFVYVEDLADACVLALKDVAENRIYNLEGDEKVSIKQIAETVDQIIGGVQIEFKEGRKGDFKGKNISNQRVKAELGWHPKISFLEGMKKYIAWYKNGISDQ